MTTEPSAPTCNTDLEGGEPHRDVSRPIPSNYQHSAPGTIADFSHLYNECCTGCDQCCTSCGRGCTCFCFCLFMALVHYTVFFLGWLFVGLMIKFEYYWQVALIGAFPTWLWYDYATWKINKHNYPEKIWWDNPLLGYFAYMVTMVLGTIPFMFPFWIEKEEPSFTYQIYTYVAVQIIFWLIWTCEIFWAITKYPGLWSFASTDSPCFCDENPRHFEIKRKIKELFPELNNDNLF